MRHEQNSLTIRLLGPPRIERNGKVVEADTRKAIALLAYLALHNERFSRDRLAVLFWPEYNQERAYANLRRTLWSLNKAVGEEWLLTDHETIGLAVSEGPWSDVVAFQQGLTLCRTHGHPAKEICAACLAPLTQAADLVRGSFLEGFSLRDSPEFDDWQVLQTENLRQEFAGVLERLVAGYNGAGESKRALEYARRWVALDPLHEPAQRQLMLTYTWAGQPTDALQQYRKCEHILDEEMGVPPEKATTQLFEAIRMRRVPPPPLRADLQQHVHAVSEVSGPVEVPAPQPAVPPTPIEITLSPPATTGIHNLPAQTTSFVGRDAEIAEIVRLLQEESDCRLLTLLGPGGIGKTRLSVQAAHAILAFGPDRDSSQMTDSQLTQQQRPATPHSSLITHQFTHGVCFVALAGIDTPELLAATIASALNLSTTGGHDPKTQLLDYVREKQLLVVLDNFEQLVEGAALLIELLDAAPGLKIIVTSRQRLNLSEEWLLVVPGLELPPVDDPTGSAGASAVQLFAERARRVQRRFVLADVQAEVVRICQLLGGIPLGIELAAAWTRSLTCAEIAQEIQHNIDFLATTLRDVPERQRSLRAVFEQSWQMLTPAEQRVFMALAVFRGGFERAAAESVAGASLPLLRALGDKSFLHRSPAGRYTIHEGLRQFAAEKLGEATEVQARHAQYYADFLEHRYTDLVNGEARVIQEVGSEMDNLRVGWEWAVAQADTSILGQALKSLASYYELRGWFSEGEQLFARTAQALAQSAKPNETVQLVFAQLRERQGWFKSLLGENRAAYTLIEESLATFRTLEADLETAYALAHLAVVQSILGENISAEEGLQASLALFQGLGNLRGQALAFQHLGLIVSRLSRDEEAIHHLQASIALLKGLNNRRDLAKAMKELGNIYTGLGDYTTARQLYLESQVMFQSIGELTGAAACLVNLGLVAQQLGNYADAERFNAEGLAFFTQFGDQRGMSMALNNLGEIAWLRGDLRQAREHLERAVVVNRTIDYRQGLAFSYYHLGCVMDALHESQARGYFGQALQLAADLGLSNGILCFAPGVANYLVSYGEDQLAIEFLSLTIHEQSVESWTRMNAQTILAEINTRRGPDTAAIAVEPSRARDLTALMDELLEKLLE